MFAGIVEVLELADHQGAEIGVVFRLGCGASSGDVERVYQQKAEGTHLFCRHGEIGAGEIECAKLLFFCGEIVKLVSHTVFVVRLKAPVEVDAVGQFVFVATSCEQADERQRHEYLDEFVHNCCDLFFSLKSADVSGGVSWLRLSLLRFRRDWAFREILPHLHPLRVLRSLGLREAYGPHGD